jgi:hypothetical protein
LIGLRPRLPKENSDDLADIKKKNSELFDNNFNVELVEYIDDFIDQIFI